MKGTISELWAETMGMREALSETRLLLYKAVALLSEDAVETATTPELTMEAVEEWCLRRDAFLDQVEDWQA